MDKELEVLDYLGQDKVFEFLTKFKKLEDEYKAMKKVYEKRIKIPLKGIVGDGGMVTANDVFKVTITQPQETEKLISIVKARKLPQDIKDMILVKSMTSSRMIVKLIEDETDEDW